MEAPNHSQQLNHETPTSRSPQGVTPSNVSIAPKLVRPIEHAHAAVREFDRETIAQWIQHAATLIRYREYGAAQNLLRHALTHDSNCLRAISLMALVLEKVGHPEEAVKCRRALVRIDPSADNQLDLAALYYGLENDEAALATYQEALATHAVPEERLFEVYKNIGNILVRKSDFDGAEDFYNRAFTIEPKSDALLVNFGTLEINRDDLEAAGARFRSAIEVNAECDRAWVGLALVHRAKGDFELSWANLERALDLNSSNRTAMKLIVEWAVRDGRVQAAASRLEKYLAADGEDAEMAFSLAKCQTLLGRFNDALFECERVVALDPEQEEAVRLRRILAERILAEAGACA
jgi:tetratricopeptide (TPR) repeat protein